MLYIIVPYRAGPDQPWRAKQLARFMDHMHAFLKGVHGQIVVVEQMGNGPFNRGALLNVGFKVCRPSEYDMVMFHDIDLLPSEELSAYYRYAGQTVVHIGGAFKRYNIDSYMGGVVLMSAKTFVEVNGYPTKFWGWGGEDDEFRIRLGDRHIVRPSMGSFNDLENMDVGAKMSFLKAHGLRCTNKFQIRQLYQSQRLKGECVEGLAETYADVSTVDKRTHYHTFAILNV